LRGEETRHARFARRSVLGDVPDFINSNPRHTGERSLQPLGQHCGLGILSREGADQPFQIIFTHFRSELNAGEACGGQQLGKTSFRWTRFNGRAIE